MDLNSECTNLLKQQTHWGYQAGGPSASEPTALACLALVAHNDVEAALPYANWLAKIQTPKGSVGVTEELEMPAWTTSLACLAWLAVDQATGDSKFQQACRQASEWILSVQGRTIPKNPQIGHDPTILAWSWALDTHSWMEPTCLAVLALKAMGQAHHQRTRDGVRMITDRLLDNGGCNFGSTMILGQDTLPQVQATGFAMLALTDETVNDPRFEKSLNYLEANVTVKTSTASLCYGILALTAHGRRPVNSEQMLRSVFKREQRGETNCYKLALILLASCTDRSWLPQMTRNEQLTNA